MKKLTLLVSLILLSKPFIYAQEYINSVQGQAQIKSVVQQLPDDPEKLRAEAFARERDLPIRLVQDNGTVYEIMKLSPTGMPMYYTTKNLTAAKTISTDRVWKDGGMELELNGEGILVGVWDEAKVRTSHVEFGSRVRIMDDASDLSDHGTHVAGTVGATGVKAGARGMANQCSINSYDWSNDEEEMRTAAGLGLLLSNHSYGYAQGYEYNFSQSRWQWWGDLAVSQDEDYKFGFYGDEAKEWDQIAYEYPKYLIMKSAGNDRADGEGMPEHYVWENGDWTLSKIQRKKDGGDYGFDCLGTTSTAKNIMVVGNALDLPDGYTGPWGIGLSGSSGFGPTDDGRVKPDIVANGSGLMSAVSEADDSYDSYSGTSMSTPSVTGSMALLQQHYKALHNDHMYASQLKALVIHTASEAQDPGPDYKYGWGLMNTAAAAGLLSSLPADKFVYETLINAKSETHELWVNGTKDIKITIAWTDPTGNTPGATLDPINHILVNDLDIRLTRDSDGEVIYPWILDPGNPGVKATRGDNVLDNVEQIVLDAAETGAYTLEISHKGDLKNGQQDYALVISGLDNEFYAEAYNELSANNASFMLTSAESYRNDSHIEWLIEPENNQPVSLYFDFLETAGPGDSVTVYDGPDISSPVLANFTDSLSNTDSLLVSTGAVLFLTFHSDEALVSRGFKARYCTTAPEGESTIQGESAPCENLSFPYLSKAQQGAWYKWEIDKDWGLEAPEEGLAELLIGSEEAELSMTPVNRCGEGQRASLLLKPVFGSPELDSIYVDLLPCINSSSYLYTSNVSGAVFEWQIPQSWTGSSSTDTIWFETTTLSGGVVLKASNSCGTGNELSQYIQVVSPPGITDIKAESTSLCAGVPYKYYVDEDPVSTFTWSATGSATIVGESVGDTVQLILEGGQSFVMVETLNHCGVIESSEQFLSSPLPPAAQLEEKAADHSYLLLEAVNEDEFDGIRWYRNGIAIEGETGSSNPLRVNLNGSYTAETTSEEGCLYLMGADEAYLVDMEDLTIRAFSTGEGSFAIENTSENEIDFQLIDLNGKVHMLDVAEPGYNEYTTFLSGVCVIRTRGSNDPGQQIKLLLR